MNEIKIFDNQKFGQLRTVMIENEPWFVATDVCRALDIDATATRRLDDDEKVTLRLTQGETAKTSDTTVINEPGLYSLVMGSRKPEAKQFKRWVTHEVIPSIRKYGMYATPTTVENILNDPDYFIELIQQYKLEKEKNKELTTQVAIQEQRIAEMKPKETYYDLVLNCINPISITEIAKDYGKSGIWLNSYLKEKGIQYQIGRTWVLYQKYANRGYTKTMTFPISTNLGEQARVHTYWTQSGRLFIYETLKKDGILPMCENEGEGFDIDDVFKVS